MVYLRKWLIPTLVWGMISWSHSLHAEPMREFIRACTYGVLAGTLVGAASLAFTSKPGDNLKNIARGASLGLYAGMALGAYVIYFVPPAGQIPMDIEGPLPGDTPIEDQIPEEYEEGSSINTLDRSQNISWVLEPLWNELGRVDGLSLNVAIWQF